MANPNLVNVSSIYGKTKGVALGTTVTDALLANGLNSNKLLKVNAVIVANKDGTNAAKVTLSVHDGSTDYYLAKTINVPADATLVVVGKDAPIYLEENQTIRGGADVAGDLDCIISYEELDDA
jgi:hypothetical protein|tara:strand:+ start:584 stop:952 length:369 start_codon:yes stop_codon:yes gene_type:complete